MKLLNMQSRPVYCHFFLRPQYRPQRPILEHPQPMFFPLQKVPSCTAVRSITVRRPFCFNAWMQLYQTCKLVNWSHSFCRRCVVPFTGYTCLCAISPSFD